MINVYVILQIHDNDDQLYEMYDLNHHVQLFDKPILKNKKDKRRRRKCFTVYFSSLFDRSIVRVLSIDTVIGIDIIFKIVSYNSKFHFKIKKSDRKSTNEIINKKILLFSQTDVTHTK